MSEVQKDSATRESNREITQNQMLRAENQALRDERDRLREALQGILDIGKRDMTNPKYDGYFEAAEAALTPAGGGKE